MLKNVLSLLLSKFYSKKESGEVAHQAFPSEQAVSLLTNESASDWGTVGQGVAPFDGYLYLSARGTGDTQSCLFLNATRVQTALIFPWATANSKTWAPISKGDSWSVEGSGAQSITLRLFKTIGGGYQALKKLLLQGGAICLSNLCNSLRRSSLLAKRSGCSKTLSRLDQTELRSKIKDLVQRLLHTQLRQTGCLGFDIKSAKAAPLICPAIATAMGVIHQGGSFQQLVAGRVKTLYMYLRGMSLSWIQTAIRRVLQECGSTRRLNFALGGASC